MKTFQRERQQIPVDRTVRGDNDRTVFDPNSMQWLCDSIAEHGLIQPIEVRVVPRMHDGMCRLCGLDSCDCGGDTVFQIHAGERRFRAHKMLGFTTIDALVLEDMGERDASMRMLVENEGREDLPPIDQAYAYHKRMVSFDMSASELARSIGVGVDKINSRLPLLKLCRSVQLLVNAGEIPIGHANLMADLGLTPDQQIAAVRIYTSRPAQVSLQVFERTLRQMLTDLETIQIPLLDWVDGAIQQIQDQPAAVWGKNAVVEVPPAPPGLPGVRQDANLLMAAIMAHYIDDLVNAGFISEAGAVGHLLVGLVRARRCMRPVRNPDGSWQ